MSYWRRHPKKDGQALLVWLHRVGWRIQDPPTYYTILCPCGDHLRQVHLTPSNPNYFRECRRWVMRQPCMANEDTIEEAR